MDLACQNGEWQHVESFTYLEALISISYPLGGWSRRRSDVGLAEKDHFSRGNPGFVSLRSDDDSVWHRSPSWGHRSWSK